MSVHFSHYQNVTYSAEAWKGTLPAVHVNMREDERFGLSLGYLTLSPEQARILSHQLAVAAEATEAHMRQRDAGDSVPLAAAA